jgi:hypothetical protein
MEYDSVGCLSGNVVMRFVRVPETIGSRRLAPAIQEWFAFQAKFDDMVGVRSLQKIWVEGNHLPEVPDGTSWVCLSFSHSIGSYAALTMGYLYNAATRHTQATANAGACSMYGGD